LRYWRYEGPEDKRNGAHPVGGGRRSGLFSGQLLFPTLVLLWLPLPVFVLLFELLLASLPAACPLLLLVMLVLLVPPVTLLF
jgi:hypothetical protein